MLLTAPHTFHNDQLLLTNSIITDKTVCNITDINKKEQLSLNRPSGFIIYEQKHIDQDHECTV